MSKKLTFEFVKSEIESEGFTLLSESYENNEQKLQLICPFGHKYRPVPWNQWQQGHRCTICCGKEVLEGFNDLKTKNPDLAKEWHPTLNDIKPEDVTCGSNKVVWWRGECGHEWPASINNRNKGTGCLDCFGNKKLTLEDVKSSIESEGFTLLSDSYKNANQKLQVRCPEKHEYPVTWGSWQQGTRCRECKGLEKHSYQDIKNHFESEGFTLLSEIYENNKQELQVRCQEGHLWKVCWGSFFFKKTRCSECAGNKKLTLEFVKLEIESEGFTLLSDSYKNAHQILQVRCPKLHEFAPTWNSWKSGTRCKTCNAPRGERIIDDILKTFNYVYTTEYKNDLIKSERQRHLRFDFAIYNKDKNLKCLIEFNGIQHYEFTEHFHEDENGFDEYKNRDNIKIEKCKELKIPLLILTDRDLNDSKTDLDSASKKKLLDFIENSITDCGFNLELLKISL